MAPSSEPLYTIHDICSATGVKRRTIEWWVRWKLVPKAVSKRNDGICYTPEHLHRVKLVKEWMEARITIAELAERIAILGDKALEVHDPYEGFDGWDSVDNGWEDEDDE